MVVVQPPPYAGDLLPPVQARGVRDVVRYRAAGWRQRRGDFRPRTGQVERGIEVLIPERDDIDLVNRVIFEELCLGIVKEESRAEYLRVIAALQQRGAQGILLGCTELGLIVDPKDVTLPLFDTTEIHAKKALALALTE